MRKKLVSLLAALVLSKFVVPAVAQVPDVGVLGLPSENPPMSATARLGSEITDNFGPDRWYSYIRSLGSPNMRDRWVEFTANQGPIAKVLGLPVPAARDVGAVLGNNAEPGRRIFSCVCLPFGSDNTVGPNKGSGAGTLFDFWPHTECPVGNVVGLSSTYSDLTAAACDAPGCTNKWNGENIPGGKFSAGVGVSYMTGFGVGRHQNFSQCQGVGTSVWLGYTTESGIEIRAGFSNFEGQQVIQPRR